MLASYQLFLRKSNLLFPSRFILEPLVNLHYAIELTPSLWSGFKPATRTVYYNHRDSIHMESACQLHGEKMTRTADNIKV